MSTLLTTGGRCRRYLVVALAATAIPLGAQEPERAATTFSVPVSLNVAVPQGPFGESVSLAGGFGGGLLWNVAGVLGLRADVGVTIYGSDTRRVPLGGGALGLIHVDVTTTNTIFGGGVGAQLGVPRRTATPYVGGVVGFSNFATSSKVSGSNSSNDPIASSTNLQDGVLARSVLGGLYIPLRRGNTLIDLGARYTWNGKRVRYLTENDISEGLGGNIVLSPRETRADLFTISLGFTFLVGTSGAPPPVPSR